MIDAAVVKNMAMNLGFDLCGFAPYQLLEEDIIHLEAWLRKGYQAGMEYMTRNLEKKRDIRQILPGAASVISLGMNYNTPFQHENETGMGKISRYAWGKDYHLLIWEKLDLFTQDMQNKFPGIETITYVDTGPVMDKSWAVKAGLGWLGKHTNIINPDSGSWFFIATVITNAEFSYSSIVADHCGSCTRCIEACPTSAIVQPYEVDANKCISYLTIENKKEIPENIVPKLDGWLFGCDVCQDVCPWNNKFGAITEKSEFFPINKELSLSLEKIQTMEQSGFKDRFANSPIKRAKLSGLKRNAAALVGRE